MNREDLQLLSQVRLTEAQALLVAGHSSGAFYLGGYAVECALKACIAKRTQRYDFPDKKLVDKSYTHDLKTLIELAKLREERAEEAKRDPIFRNNLDLALEWSEESRYERHDSEQAKALVEAIGNGEHGVLAWLKHHW